MWCVNHLTLVQRLKDESIKNNYSYNNLLINNIKSCKLLHEKQNVAEEVKA